MAEKVTCPKCEGAGVFSGSRVDQYGTRTTIKDIRCYVCNGTGQASLLRPMGTGGAK